MLTSPTYWVGDVLRGVNLGYLRYFFQKYSAGNVPGSSSGWMWKHRFFALNRLKC